MKKTLKHENIRNLVLCAILSALIIVMTVIPYTGYIYYGLIEITTLHIVVILGSLLLGWKYGAFLGFVWGMSCLVRAFTNPLWVLFTNPVISVLPRIIVGIVPALVYNALTKHNCKSYFSCIVATIAGTVTNTVLVLTAMYLFSSEWNGSLVYTIYATLIGVNGLIELAAAVILVPLVYKLLQPKESLLGIDFGCSTIKLALIQNGKCIRTKRIEKTDSLEDAVSEVCNWNIKRICVTGVGADAIEDVLNDKPVVHVDEFTAISRGASFCSGKSNFLAACIGTGTSFVRVTPFRSWHVGGTGLGGGSIQGLANKLCSIDDMKYFKELASNGNLSNVDLQIRDICSFEISNLQPTSTVACMYKNDGYSNSDIAAGICNMIFENIGVMSAFATKRMLTRTVVLIGTVTEWPVAMKSLENVATLHNIKFIVPNLSGFCTAIGATLIN